MRTCLSRETGIRLYDALPGARIVGDAGVRVLSCCSDSRLCQPGDVFVALMGREYDGHDYAHEALRRGARAVVAERHLPISSPQFLVRDSRVAHGRVCQAFAGQPSQRMRLVGITGTHGKTTAAMLTTAVLEAADQQVGIVSSLGCCDSENTTTDDLTTATPPMLAHWLGNMLHNNCDYGVLEVSSPALAERRISGVQLDTAVITNLGRGNLAYHGSLANYRKATLRIIDQLGSRRPLAINVDDQHCRRILDELDVPVLTFAVNHPADVTARVIEEDNCEQTFMLTAGGESVAVRSHLVGQLQLPHFLAAATVGLLAGIDLATVARGLEFLTCLPGRMERIQEIQEFATFIDHAQDPDRLAASLRSLRRVTRGRLICVFGANDRLASESRPELGRAAERQADIAVITSDNPGNEPPLQIAHDILDGCQRPGKPHIIPDRAKAIGWALQTATAGDTVLIAGKGNHTGQTIGNQVVPFDDRQVAVHCLTEPTRSRTFGIA